MAVKCILTGQTPSVLDGVTENVQTQLNGKVDKVTGKGLSTNDLTNTLKSNYDAAYTHSTSTHAPTDAEKNVIVGIQKNGTDVSVNSSTRKVNITVPTSASDVGAVPTSRTVNGKALSANITLSASDVSALPDSTTYVSTVDGSSGAITTNAVKYTSQTLTDAQKTQARDNIGAQQKLYNLTFDTPIVENQTIDSNSPYAFSSPITLNEYDLYWIDVQTVYEGEVQNRYQLLSRAVNGDSGITVQWMGYIVLDTTGVTLATSSDRSYIITIAKVLDYEIPVDSAIVNQEGSVCVASNTAAHAEGNMTIASGYGSHAEGGYTTASDYHSHAEGYDTKASSPNQHVQGIYNIEDSSNTYAHIVGNGDSDTTRSNAHTLDWNGNAWFAGDVYVGSTSRINKDAGSKKLAKESTTVSATLSASLWSGDSAPYNYTLSVTGVTATSNQELLPALDITDEQLTALQAANIQDGGQAANSVTLTAFGDKPTIDLPIRVIVRGDS